MPSYFRTIMIYKDIPKAYANRIIAAIHELHPEIQTRILSEDRVLFELGFTTDILCTLEIQITQEQAETIWSEVISLESEAFDYTDEQMKDAVFRRGQIKRQEHYARFALLEEIMLEIMNAEE